MSISLLQKIFKLRNSIKEKIQSKVLPVNRPWGLRCTMSGCKILCTDSKKDMGMSNRALKAFKGIVEQHPDSSVQGWDQLTFKSKVKWK